MGIGATHWPPQAESLGDPQPHARPLAVPDTAHTSNLIKKPYQHYISMGPRRAYQCGIELDSCGTFLCCNSCIRTLQHDPLQAVRRHATHCTACSDNTP